ncbi:MAG: ferredoxin family protein [Verrucomicrobiales bacterium]|nr:ferredoxin family protein [Verrucomicrobiales bacterium]
MSLKDQKTLRLVLTEAPGAKRYHALQKLLEHGYTVTCTTETNFQAESNHSNVLVVTGVTSSENLLEQAETTRSQIEAVKHGEWKPWFPVIDYDRCTNCMQCLSFCLFGVYGVDQNHKIEVQNNDSCKTNCPACSRVCPEAAIMFPKYKTGPINGDAVTAADLDREKMKIDISALLGGDVYSMLRTRSERAQSRFSKERDPDKALKERQRCLVKLAEAGDIPPEVLMALPSPEEIIQRAEVAKAKAAAALQNSPQQIS